MLPMYYNVNDVRQEGNTPSALPLYCSSRWGRRVMCKNVSPEPYRKGCGQECIGRYRSNRRRVNERAIGDHILFVGWWGCDDHLSLLVSFCDSRIRRCGWVSVRALVGRAPHWFYISMNRSRWKMAGALTA